jgi:NAD-dependent SIR2 family protein deacetylase
MNDAAEQLSSAVLYGIEMARERIGDRPIAVLTGAGISTDSGIPDYRGAGRIERHPMTFESFMGSIDAQRRYWARSYVGFSRISEAKPNAGHFALERAEARGQIVGIVTQNVDGLHQAAGSSKVIDLHGRLDRVICMSCRKLVSRSELDSQIEALNPAVLKYQQIEFTPDGDAEIEAASDFRIPVCLSCQGTLKPDVVFFGESVPLDRVESAKRIFDSTPVLLVAGTSLAVNSGLRFVRAAAKAGREIIIVNLGDTKADHLAIAKIEANTSLVLDRLLK